MGSVNMLEKLCFIGDSFAYWAGNFHLLVNMHIDNVPLEVSPGNDLLAVVARHTRLVTVNVFQMTSEIKFAPEDLGTLATCIYSCFAFSID